MTVTLWIYIALLLAGGLMGFIKGKSKASLIASSLFAIPLILAALGVIQPFFGDATLFVLLIFFGARFIKGRKFMPNGLMLAATIVAILVRLGLRS
jgi:uncharacterized membrane protein (UPF0136 family)